LQAVKFDIIYNFDKDKNGKCSPINKAAEHKFITGLFDDVNKANTKSYLDEIFKIAGFKFKGEKYIL
jgi:heptosyltransferase-2